MSIRTLKDGLDVLRRSPRREGARLVLHHFWSRRLVLVLRCDLTTLPPARPAKIPVEMRETNPGGFTGFDLEQSRVQGVELIEVVTRERLRTKGFGTMFVATSETGAPIYVQWLSRPTAPRVTAWAFPGTLAVPAPDEVLIEGAYTFMDFRGKKAMADGMGQLLRIARDEGYRWAVTNVAGDNIPSLRGCAHVGFDLDHQLVVTRSLSGRRARASVAGAEARRQWQAATARPAGA
jgi:hypothetical protein